MVLQHSTMASPRSSRRSNDQSPERFSVFEFLMFALLGAGLSLLVLYAMWPLVCYQWAHRDHRLWRASHGTLESLVIVPKVSRRWSTAYEVQARYNFTVESRQFSGVNFSDHSWSNYDARELSEVVKSSLPELAGDWTNAYSWYPESLALRNLPKQVSVLYYPPDPNISALTLNRNKTYGLLGWTIFIITILATALFAFWAFVIDALVILGVLAHLLPEDRSRIDNSSEHGAGESAPQGMHDAKFIDIVSQEEPEPDTSMEEWYEFAQETMLKGGYANALRSLEAALRFSSVEYGTPYLELEIKLSICECLFQTGQIENSLKSLMELKKDLENSQIHQLDERVENLRKRIANKMRSVTPPSGSSELS